MKPSFIPLINHSLTTQQKKEIHTKLECQKVVNPPQKIQNLWKNISPDGPLNREEMEMIVNFIQENTQPQDFVLVQGDFGATFYIADFCLKNNLVPMYATTKREYNEKTGPNGTVERYHLFRHVQFRKYIPWEQNDGPRNC